MLKRLAVLALLALASPAQAVVTIDFSDQAASFTNNLGNQLFYPDATFSSPAGLRVFTFPGLLDKGLCPSTIACLSPLTIDFTSAVSNISFGVFQVDSTRLLSISGLTTTGTFSRLLTLSPGFATNIVNLADLTNVTRLTLDGTTDEEGYIYDNFSFDLSSASSVSAVPEPGSWLMMLVGFGMMGTALRRRRPRQRANAVA